MTVTYVEAFSDNYIWLYEVGDQLIVVDPGQADPVLRYLEKSGKSIGGILLTHKHDDHIGGVRDLLDTDAELTVYGPAETVDLNTHTMGEGETFELLGKPFEVLATPGHTAGHISYLSGDQLFCGDALFSGGCGRVFTGDYQGQFETLASFKQLDDNVKVYPGHEYTVTNLSFAHEVEPDNQAITEALEKAKNTRDAGRPTLPSTIGFEKSINLFMQAENLESFKSLRDRRDDY